MPPEGRAPDTDGYDISEVRGDLRFSRRFIPILSPSSCFLFPVAATLVVPFSPSTSPLLRLRSRQSFSSSLLFYLALLLLLLLLEFRPRVSLARFISSPRCHPNVHRLDLSSVPMKEEKEMKE